MKAVQHLSQHGLLRHMHTLTPEGSRVYRLARGRETGMGWGLKGMCDVSQDREMLLLCEKSGCLVTSRISGSQQHAVCEEI